MTIQVKCPNDHSLQVKDELAGKRVRCPKCKEIVTIPEIAVELVDDLPEFSPTNGSFFDGIPDFSAPTNEVPFGSSPLQGYSLSPTPTPNIPQVPAASSSASRTQTPRGRTAPKKNRSEEQGGYNLLAYFGVGVGLALALLVLGLGFTWVLYSEPETAMGGAHITEQMKKDLNPPVILQRTETRQEPLPKVAQNANPSSSAASPATGQPSSKVPTEATQIAADSRSILYRLPSLSWSSAYDAELGRIAITDETKGIVVYSIDDLSNGKTTPVAVHPVAGNPSALCFKQFGSQRMFLCASTGDSEITLLNTATLEVVEKLRIQDAAFVNFLASSSNPEDPYLYFCKKQTIEGFLGSYLGRISLTNKQAENFDNKMMIADITTSPDGQMLYARTQVRDDFRNHYSLGTWDQFKKANQDMFQFRYNYGSPIRFAGDTVAVYSHLYHRRYDAKGQLLYMELDEAEYEPLASFRSMPVEIGVSEKGVVLGSSVDQKVIESISVPGEVMRAKDTLDDGIAQFKDPRFRQHISNSVGKASLAAYADDTRKLAIATFDDQLMIAFVDKLGLPTKNPLQFKLDLPTHAELGQLLEIKLPASAIEDKVEFEFQFSGTLPSGRIKHEIQDGNRVSVPGLTADMDAEQTVIMLFPDDQLQGRPFPFPIRVGTERMMVHDYDKSKEWYIVDRTEAIEHTIKDPVEVLSDDESEEVLPTCQDGRIRWSPSIKSLGKKNLVVRARSGQNSREWLWPIEVGYGVSEDQFPFYVQGIVGSPDSQLAAVWGIPQSDASTRYPVDSGRKRLAEQSIVGIYDTAKKEILSQVQLPYEIDAALLDRTGLYATSLNATVNLFGNEKKPGRVLRFDASSLKLLGAKPIETQERTQFETEGYTLFVQAGNRLVVQSNRNNLEYNNDLLQRPIGKDYRFKMPDLAEERPPSATHFPLDGMVQTGPIKEGVLWDEALEKPLLLLAPSAFGVKVTHFNAWLGDRQVRLLFSGPNASLLTSVNWKMPAGLHFPGRNTILRSTEKELQVFTNAQINAGDSTPPLARVPYGPIEKEKEDDPRRRFSDQQSRDNKREYTTFCDSYVLATSKGRVFRVHKDALPKAPPNFCFDEKQDIFAIEAGKKVEVKYSAPGAMNYRLRVYLNPPYLTGEGQEAKLSQVLDLESADGTFEIEFDPDQVVDAVLGALKHSSGPGNQVITPEKITKTIKDISAPFKELVGRAPKSLPAVASVVITADHEDGFQRAGLIHAYLVEPPIKSLVQKATEESSKGR